MSAMKNYSRWTFIYLLIFAVLILTWDAQSDDSDSSIEIRVCRNTVHASLGQEVRISCPVIFCNDSLPTVTWYKVGETDVPVNVSSGSHIKAEWTRVKDLECVFYLVFKNILKSDSGQYGCKGGGTSGHLISITVYVNSTPADTFWPLMYRVIGSVVFVIVVILICVTSKRGCKGKPRKTTKQSQELYTHIYDNDV